MEKQTYFCIQCGNAEDLCLKYYTGWMCEKCGTYNKEKDSLRKEEDSKELDEAIEHCLEKSK